MDGSIDGWMGGWMDGQWKDKAPIAGWIDGLMNRWVNKLKSS